MSVAEVGNDQEHGYFHSPRVPFKVDFFLDTIKNTEQIFFQACLQKPNVLITVVDANSTLLDLSRIPSINFKFPEDEFSNDPAKKTPSGCPEARATLFVAYSISLEL